MLKIIRDCWAKNQDKLREVIAKLPDDEIQELGYENLVTMAFGNIFESETIKLNLTDIHVIDDGEYQGTFIYLIPFDCYQPSCDEYLMTYVYYGSCSGCDTLQAIQAELSCYGVTRKTVNNDLLELCLDILRNAIKPYNFGWRQDAGFEQIETED